MESYATALSIYNQHYPFFDDPLAGEILDDVWNNIDNKDFLVKFNQVVSSKQTTANNVIQFLPPTYSQTGGLLKRIQEEYPELSKIQKNE